MKKITAILYSVAVSLSLNSCLKDNCANTYSIYEPIYKTLTQVHNDIKSLAPQPLQKTGKFFLYGSYIFLNEVAKGIHIIDNSDPADPKNIAFISVPGNLDIAVKGSYLYADCYTEMVVLNISDPTHAQVEKFIPNTFPERAMYQNTTNPDSAKVIVGYNQRDTTVDCDTYQRWNSCTNCMMATASGATFYASAPTGIAGSMARFAVVNNYLYGVSVSQLKTFDISNGADPKISSTKNVGWNIETIYPFKNKLFLGSSSGMFIFNTDNPAGPEREGMFSHARACDPVVADGNTAYVTLRSGTFCQGFNNQLDVLNITNTLQPLLLKSYGLANPHGLSKDGDLLFICDGKGGLKIYNAQDPLSLQLVRVFPGLEAYDIITNNKKAMVVASDGLYQFDYADVKNIKMISKLNIEN